MSPLVCAKWAIFLAHEWSFTTPPATETICYLDISILFSRYRHGHDEEYSTLTTLVLVDIVSDHKRCSLMWFLRSTCTCRHSNCTQLKQKKSVLSSEMGTPV
jgi:hypothetical protein